MKKIIYIIIYLNIYFLNTVHGQFAGGSGTITSPYLIRTATQFDSIRYSPINKDTYYKLLNDINLDDLGITASGNWTTIIPLYQARIHINGDYHTLKNMKQYNNIINKKETGIISNMPGGSIRNIIVKKSRIIDTSGTGTINFNNQSGSFSFIVSATTGAIDLNYVVADSCIMYLRFAGGNTTSQTGGIIGKYSSVDSIYQCAVINSSIRVDANENTYALYLGAIVGEAGGGLISRCYASNIFIKGKRNSTSTSRIGALIGGMSGSVYAKVEDSYFHGSIQATSTAGAVVGFIQGMGNTHSSSSIIRCYSVCKNLSAPQLGAFGWTGQAQKTFYCYFNADSIGTYKSSSLYTTLDTAIAKTTSQLKNINTYDPSWNFIDVWQLNPAINGGFPYLKWNKQHSIAFLSPTSGTIYNAENHQDTLYVSWVTSSKDSTNIKIISKYFTRNILVKGDTTLKYFLDDRSFDFKVVAEIPVINIRDTLYLHRLGSRYINIDTVYVSTTSYNPVVGSKSNLDRVANRVGVIKGEFLTFHATSKGVDTIDFYIEQEDSSWYYLGKKEVDTTQIPNVTIFNYNLKDHSPKCTCHRSGGRQHSPDRGKDEGPVSNNPFTEKGFDPIVDTSFTEKTAFLNVWGPLTADPVFGMKCHSWQGDPWDLSYVIDVSCGWKPDSVVINGVRVSTNVKWGGTGSFSITSVNGNQLNKTVQTQKFGDYHSTPVKYTTTISTSGAFSYSISDYNVTLTSSLTNQSKTFNLKNLDIGMRAAFMGGSGAIHPPFTVALRVFGGVPFLFIGMTPPAIALFYVFRMDARLSYTLIQQQASQNPAWGIYGGSYGGGQSGVSTTKTRYRGLHSKDGIWKYGNPQGIKP
jgi:hypothetical protein